MPNVVSIPISSRLHVTLCNHNFSKEGIFHPDRVMTEYDLLYMQNGEWDITEEDTEYHLAPHSVLLLEPGKHHFSREKCSPMMRNVYIHFTRPSSVDAAAPCPLSSNAILSQTEEAPLQDSSLTIGKLTDCSGNREILHLFERVVESFFSDAADKDFRCSHYLEEILLQLSDLQAADSKKTDVLITEILHRFHCTPDRFLSPEELARDYAMSVRTLSGRFKTRTGRSIHQYQLWLKLNMAYDILPMSPGRSLRDIALGYGFYDEFQFSRLFKRQFGISPSERR